MTHTHTMAQTAEVCGDTAAGKKSLACTTSPPMTLAPAHVTAHAMPRKTETFAPPSPACGNASVETQRALGRFRV